MKYVINFITFFDVYGSSYSPSIGGKDHEVSIPGGVAGIFFLYATIHLIVTYSENMILKNDPNIVERKVMNATDIRINLTLSFSYKISLQLKDNYIETMTKENRDNELKFLQKNFERLFTPQIFHEVKSEVTDAQNKTRVNRDYRPIEEKPCNTSKFGPLTPREKEEIGNSKCLDIHKNSDIELYQSPADPHSKFVLINVYKCRNHVNSTGSKNCFTEKQQIDYFKRYEFNVYVRHSGLIFKPREAYKPFEHFYGLIFFRLIPSKHSIIKKFYIRKFKVVSDFNIVVNEDSHTDENQGVYKDSYYIWEDVYKKGFVDKVSRRLVLTMVLACDSKRIEISRTYPKLPDICANVMGTVGILSFMFSLLLQRVYDSITTEIMVHQLFNLTEDKIDKINKKRKSGNQIGGVNTDNKIELEDFNSNVRVSGNVNVNINEGASSPKEVGAPGTGGNEPDQEGEQEGDQDQGQGQGQEQGQGQNGKIQEVDEADAHLDLDINVNASNNLNFDNNYDSAIKAIDNKNFQLSIDEKNKNEQEVEDIAEVAAKIDIEANFEVKIKDEPKMDDEQKKTSRSKNKDKNFSPIKVEKDDEYPKKPKVQKKELEKEDEYPKKPKVNKKELVKEDDVDINKDKETVLESPPKNKHTANEKKIGKYN